MRCPGTKLAEELEPDELAPLRVQRTHALGDRK